MSKLFNISQKYSKRLGIWDTEGLPEGAVVIDISTDSSFLRAKEKIVSMFPKKRVHKVPKFTPHLKGYNLYPVDDFMKIIDFSSFYYIDDLVKNVPEIAKVMSIKKVKEKIESYYNKQFDSSFGVYQVSAYRNYKNAEEITAHAKWHNDTHPMYSKKLLVYLSDILTESDGPTQIKYADGTIKSIYGKAGTAIFIDINLYHRAHQIHDDSKNSSRDILNFELCPIDYEDKQLVQALGGDVMFPEDLENAFNIETSQVPF